MIKKLSFGLLLIRWICLLFMASSSLLFSQVSVGINQLLSDPHYSKLLQGKRIGLVTNHTAVNEKLVSTIELMKQQGVQLKALFGPEHGIDGNERAEVQVQDRKDSDGIPVYSLYGKFRRPTPEMLKDIDLLIYDIQDIGSRSYTYISTLFYVMEEAARHKIKVVVADRPNPLGGKMVDGPLLDLKWRSFVGYISVPYCHGMTVGELALFFNKEYHIGCDLTVVPMKGWDRSMAFRETGLYWMPTSPQIPEPDTPFFYPTTGPLGELYLVNIGVGYTLPFKVVGAPWVDATLLCEKLNVQKLPGVLFHPIFYQPFFGPMEGKNCQGVKIVITDQAKYHPVTTGYIIMGLLKTLYPEQFREAMTRLQKNKEMFCKINGTEEVYNTLKQEKYPAYKLKALCDKDREVFLTLRKQYLLPNYSER